MQPEPPLSYLSYSVFLSEVGIRSRITGEPLCVYVFFSRFGTAEQCKLVMLILLKLTWNVLQDKQILYLDRNWFIKFSYDLP